MNSDVYVDPNADEDSVCLIWEIEKGKEDGELISVCGTIEIAKRMVSNLSAKNPENDYTIEVVPLNMELI